MNEQEEKIDVRGAIKVTIHGKELQLVPSYSNLARLEQAVGKTSVVLLSRMMSGDVSPTDISKLITTCAEPIEKDDKLPKPWNHVDVGQYILDEGYAGYLTIAITFLGAALSAKPKKRADSGGGSGSGES